MTRKPSKPAKAAAKKPAAKKKPAARASKSASSAKKAKTKKPEKPLPAKKAAAPAPKAKGPKAAAPRPAPAKAPKAAPKVREPKSSTATKKKPAVAPTGVAKPGLGHKWSCFNCGAKFYDLGKPIPVCPKCDADQRDRPPVAAEAPPPTPQAKRPAMAPMSRFLDDDEVAAPEPDEFGAAAGEADVEEPEAGEIDIEALDEPAALGVEGEFSEPEEE